MNRQMITASNSMNQLQQQVDMLANNIANLNTVGYKRSEASFEDLLTQTIKNQPHADKEQGRSTPYGLRVGHGSKLGQAILRQEQGGVQITDRPLDVMIEGEGWFRTLRTWTDADGGAREEWLYTRDGSFQLEPHPAAPDEEVRLITSQGWPVLDADGEEVTFVNQYDRMEMDSEGNIRVYDADSPQELIAETHLGVTLIERPDLLVAVGENHFRLPGDADEHVENGLLHPVHLNDLLPEERPARIRQGALETSNVDLQQEITELMLAQRFMQFQARSISMADEMMGMANSIRG